MVVGTNTQVRNYKTGSPPIYGSIKRRGKNITVEEVETVEKADAEHPSAKVQRYAIIFHEKEKPGSGAK